MQNLWPKIAKDIDKLTIPERVDLFAYLIKTYEREFLLAPMGKVQRNFYER